MRASWAAEAKAVTGVDGLRELGLEAGAHVGVERPAFITGSELIVDGGLAAWP